MKATDKMMTAETKQEALGFRRFLDGCCCQRSMETVTMRLRVKARPSHCSPLSYPLMRMNSSFKTNQGTACMKLVAMVKSGGARDNGENETLPIGQTDRPTIPASNSTVACGES